MQEIGNGCKRGKGQHSLEGNLFIITPSRHRTHACLRVRVRGVGRCISCLREGVLVGRAKEEKARNAV